MDAIFTGGVQAHQGVAFTCRHYEGSQAVRLKANLSKGLLIIASITGSRDGQPGSFLREFFYRSNPGDAPPARTSGPSGAPAQGHCAAVPDSRPYLGRWINTDEEARGMVEAEFKSQGPRLALHVHGSDGSLPAEWGEVEVELLIDRSGLTEGTCIAARYDLGDRQVDLHGWIKLGVLVLASFTCVDQDDPRSNTFDRDFFYRIFFDD